MACLHNVINVAWLQVDSGVVTLANDRKPAQGLRETCESIALSFVNEKTLLVTEKVKPTNRAWIQAMTFLDPT